MDAVIFAAIIGGRADARPRSRQRRGRHSWACCSRSRWSSRTCLVAAIKGKVWSTIGGMFIPLVGIVAAIRLAQPRIALGEAALRARQRQAGRGRARARRATTAAGARSRTRSAGRPTSRARGRGLTGQEPGERRARGAPEDAAQRRCDLRQGGVRDVDLEVHGHHRRPGCRRGSTPSTGCSRGSCRCGRRPRRTGCVAVEGETTSVHARADRLAAAERRQEPGLRPPHRRLAEEALRRPGPRERVEVARRRDDSARRPDPGRADRLARRPPAAGPGPRRRSR